MSDTEQKFAFWPQNFGFYCLRVVNSPKKNTSTKKQKKKITNLEAEIAMCIAVCIPHVVSQQVKMVIPAWDDKTDGIQVIYFYKMRERGYLWNVDLGIPLFF